MNRAAVSSLCVITLLYAMSVIGFSVSVLALVNESKSDSDIQRNNTNGTSVDLESGSGDIGSASGSGEVGLGEIDDVSGSGDLQPGNLINRSVNETSNKTLDNERATQTACVEISSESFILAVVFLSLLFIFLAAVLFSLGYECSHNGFCYQRSIYDPTVTVFENETSFLA